MYFHSGDEYELADFGVNKVNMPMNRILTSFNFSSSLMLLLVVFDEK